MAMFRLNKIMDEYVAGWGSQYNCSATTLKMALDMLKLLKEDLSKLAARNLHELLRCWGECPSGPDCRSPHRHKLFARKPDGPAIIIGRIFPKIDEGKWGDVFVNSIYDEEKDEFQMLTRPSISWWISKKLSVCRPSASGC